tara:strand:- start:4140 stop:4241 length:102 start_codon:yes stop_codon:yes gene_type:complete
MKMYMKTTTVKGKKGKKKKAMKKKTGMSYGKKK